MAMKRIVPVIGLIILVFALLACERQVKNGRVVKKYKNGNLHIVANYKDGRLDGVYRELYESGFPKTTVIFKNGKPDGESFFYGEYGNILLKETYEDGQLIKRVDSTEGVTTVTNFPKK
jgi:antitoxin component YwqK of YwqJK toxin-antitoxin module